MKPLKTKAQVRAEIEAQVDAFIDQGGAVDSVPMGASGRETGTMAPMSIHFDRQQQPRTQVQDVIQAIESRRHSKPPITPNRPRRPRKQIIYDDFGQPLRWQWVED